MRAPPGCGPSVRQLRARRPRSRAAGSPRPTPGACRPIRRINAHPAQGRSVTARSGGHAGPHHRSTTPPIGHKANGSSRAGAPHAACFLLPAIDGERPPSVVRIGRHRASVTRHSSRGRDGRRGSDKSSCRADRRLTTDAMSEQCGKEALRKAGIDSARRGCRRTPCVTPC